MIILQIINFKVNVFKMIILEMIILECFLNDYLEDDHFGNDHFASNHVWNDYCKILIFRAAWRRPEFRAHKDTNEFRLKLPPK